MQGSSVFSSDDIKCPACNMDANPNQEFYRLDKYGKKLPQEINISKILLSKEKAKFNNEYMLDIEDEITIDSEDTVTLHNSPMKELSSSLTKDPENIICEPTISEEQLKETPRSVFLTRFYKFCLLAMETWE